MKDVASEVVDYFFHSISRHASLRHLDLSFNDFNVNECRKLGVLLRRNSSIVGLHIDGNRGIVDNYGFLTETEDIASIKTYEELQHEVNLKIAKKVFLRLYYLWNDKNISPSMLFRAMNEDGEGNVDSKEFLKGLKDICDIDLSTKEVDAVFKIVDDDGSGEISQRELSRAIRAAGKERTNQPIEDSSDSDNDLDIEDISFHHAPKRQATLVDADLSLKINERCWVCSGFSEQSIIYKPYAYKNGHLISVKVHISHDEFLPKAMIWNDVDKCFQYFCMAPPGYMRFYFTVNKRSTFSTDEISIPLTISGRIPQDLGCSQRKDGESWWVLLKRLLVQTRRCNLRLVNVRQGPLINFFVQPRNSTTGQSSRQIYQKAVKSIVTRCKDTERMIELVENTDLMESQSLRMACKRILLYSVRIDLIGFKNIETKAIDKTKLEEWCYKNYFIVRKLYDYYLILQSRRSCSLADDTFCTYLKMNTALIFCRDFKIVMGDSVVAGNQQESAIGCIEMKKIFKNISETQYDYVNFPGFFRFLIKLSTVCNQKDQKMHDVESASLETHSEDITSMLDTIVSNPIAIRILNDYKPCRYTIMLFESSIICDALASVLVEIRSVFAKFCKKEVNSKSYENTLDMYGIPFHDLLRILSIKDLHKCYGFTNEILMAIMLATTGKDRSNGTGWRQYACQNSATFEEFVKILCRVSYALLLVFFETHTAESSFKKVFRPILKEDVELYLSEEELQAKEAHLSQSLPQVVRDVDFDLIFKKILKSEDALVLSLKYVVSAMVKQI